MLVLNNSPVETKAVREVTKTVDTDSFFTYFKSRKAPEGTADHDEEESDEERDKLVMAIQDDMGISDEISHQIIPRAIYYYFNLVEGDDDDDECECGHSDCDSDEEEGDKKKCSKKGKGKDKDKDKDSDKGEPASKKECKQQ